MNVWQGCNSVPISLETKADPLDDCTVEYPESEFQNERLLNVPSSVLRLLIQDLEAAGITKCDDRGRTPDVHALRHTFGTHLSKAEVPLKTAQAALRQSSPTLTANI